MALTAFRKAKLLHVFNTFFDINDSGTIDEKDLDIAIKKVCGARGWEKDDPNYERTRQTLKTLWNVLSSCADVNDDKQVTVEEWYSAWTNEMKGHQWSITFRDLMFLLEDATGDGTIDADEYVALYTALGVPEPVCRQAYERLDKDGEGISKEKFDQLWDDYFTSDDKSMEGNFIFGRTDF
ncbi:UNVERIFIED_CONTAM: hypothetical protein RMT77_007034 [Armadillidium vulgare]